MNDFYNKVKSMDNYSIVNYFFKELLNEFKYYKKSGKYLNNSQYKDLLKYYKNYNHHNIDYLSYYYTLRLKKIIDLILKSKKQVNILDAGCGLGTITILFSLLGSKVMGVDLSNNRIEIANNRIKYYCDKYNDSLKINFKNVNILKFKFNRKFDCIFANEFISHVDPFIDFIKMANNNLKYFGTIIISDTNNDNPYSRFQAWLVHRKVGLYTKCKDPKSNQDVSYACERLLTIRQLRSALSKCGFSIDDFQSFGFAPRSFFNKNLFNWGHRTISSIPVLRNFGALFNISGVKIREI